MNSGALLLATLLSAFVLSACSGQVKLSRTEVNQALRQAVDSNLPVIFPTANPSVADGKVIYERLNCAQCHGIDGGGNNFQAPSLLNDPAKVEADRTPIFQYQTLYYGVPGWDHPVLKDKVSRQEVWDLVFYVRSFSRPPLTAEELHKLGSVFGSNCADCHGVRGFGDGQLAHNLEPLPANFHQYDRFFDRQDSMIYTHIAEGLYPAAMPSFYMRQDRLNGVVFDQQFITQMARYVRHFATNYGPSSVSGSHGDADADKK